MKFEQTYAKVSGIVHKARQEFYIKLWEKSDWDQEGMMVLYELLEKQPQLYDDNEKLYVYFKVKFRNHIKDVIRKQESYKRKFDRMAHEDIHDLSHVVKSPGLVNDEFILLQDMLQSYRQQLNSEQLEQYEKLMAGQSFSGRKQMIRDLQDYLADFI